MKHFYFLFSIVLLVNNLGFGQTTIYTQDFDGSSPTWNYTSNPTPYSTGSDDWDIVTTNSAPSGTTGSFWGVQDIDNPNGGGAFEHTLTFDAINVTSYNSVEISFDFYTKGFDAGDEIRYEVFYGSSGSEIGQGIVGLNKNTQAWTTITVTIPDTADSAYIVLGAQQNGGTDYAGFDNIKIEGTAGTGCTPPTTQASSYSTTSLGSDSATLNWTSGNGDEVLVLVKESAAVDTDPTDGTSYTGNTAFSSGTELGTGNYAVYAGTTANSVSITGLSPGVTYHVAIFEYNTTDTCYLTPGLTGNFTTSCSTPTDISGLSSTIASEQVDLSWSNGSCYDDILVVAKASTAVTVSPSGDGTTYTANASFGSGTDLGIGEYAVYKGTGTSVSVSGLTNGTTYHFEVFARKGTSWSAGVVINETPFVIEEAVAGDLLITEVSGDDSDGSNDNGYMEIFNRSSKYINLGNIEARYFNSNNGSNSTQQVTLSGTLSPGSFIIVTQNGSNYTTAFSDTADGTGTNFFFNGGDDGCDVYHTSNGVIDQFNDNGTGQTAWNWNDNFTYKRNTTASGALESSWDADGTNNTPRSKTNLYFWTGATDTTWGTSSNWDAGSIPGSTTSVILANESNSPSITTSISIANLTNENNSTLLVSKTGNLEISGNLTNNGSLTLDSDSNEFSSLIAGSANGTGTLSYNKYTNEIGSSAIPGNDLISPPLSGQVFSEFATANTGANGDLATSGNTTAFAPFDNSSGTYVNYTDTETATLSAGKGYRAATDVAGGSTLKFSGSVNTGTVSINVTRFGVTYGTLNLIGNPYPSYVDIPTFLAHEVASGVSNQNLIEDIGGVYEYKGDGTFSIINNANSTGRLLAPGQAFFIPAINDNGQIDAYDIEFTSTMRTTGTSDDFIDGRDSETLTFLKLNMSTSNKTFNTEFYFNENASQGIDPGYDAVVWGNDAPDYALYSHSVQNNTGLDLGLQALSDLDVLDIKVPLGVNANAGEQLTFSISELNLPTNTEIYLEDVLKNTFTLLNNGDYILTPTNQVQGTGRFFLTFTNSALSVNTDKLSSINIYNDLNLRKIVFEGLIQEPTRASIYDVQGRQLNSMGLNTSQTIQFMDVSTLSSGIYIISLTNNNKKTISKKIIIK